MVLIDSLNETMEALVGNDEGKFLEERMLLKQMGFFIDLNSLYEPLKNHFNSGVDKELLSPKLKKKYSDALWISILEKFYNIIPDKKMAESFRDTFEYNEKKEKNSRLGILQNNNITYFIEDLKSKVNNGIHNMDDAYLILKEFEEYLIMPGSFILDNPNMNLGLDESIELFKSITTEYKDNIGTKAVK